MTVRSCGEEVNAVADIFLSYASADRTLAARITEQIRAAGHQVFLDSDRENGIAPGTAWQRALFRELRICDAVVFLNSGASQASMWCHSELALAASLGKRVYPIDLDPGLAPHPLLQALQGIAFDGAIDTGIRRLIGKLALDGLADATGPAWQRGRPPYPGLLALDVADAGVFFGRTAEVKNLTDRANLSLAQPDGDLIVVIGPSGSGKSSLVRAGLAARLAAPGSDWVVASPFEPGTRPLERMANQLAALAPDHLPEHRCRDWLLAKGLGSLADWLIGLHARPPAALAKRLLITVDQAEQLAAVRPGQKDPSDEKEEFLAVLASGLGPGSPVTVVTTVRSDRFGEIQRLPVIGSRIDQPFVIGPIGRAQLAAVIEGPARRADLSFAPGLVGLIIDEATQGGRSEAVDALPFLAFTLREMYELARREDSRVLTEADYDQVGRIAGAIVKGTETAESRLPAGSGPILDLLLPRLVTMSEDRSPAGRAVSRDKLTPAEQAIVVRLEDQRLLAGDEYSVRLTHDHLITAWPRLRRAVTDGREDLLLEGRIERQAADWQRGHGGFLGRGDAAAAAAWLARQAAHGADHADLGKYIHASQRALRLRRLTVALIAIVLVVLTAASGTGGIIAVNAANNADQQRTLAVSGQLAALSEEQDDEDPVTAALLAAAAWDEAPGSPQARESMLQVLAQPVHAVLAEGGPVKTVAFSPDHGGILATSGRAIVLYRLATGRPIGSPITVPGGADGLAFDAAGTVLATADGDGTARLWNIATGREIGPAIEASSSNGVNAVAFSPSGTVLATADGDGTARLWNVATHRQIGHALIDGSRIITGSQVTDVAFSPSGKILATASRDGTARLWRIATQQQIGRAMTDGHNLPDIGEMFAVAFSPQGTTLATADQDGAVGLWDVATQHRRGRPFTVAGADDVTFSPDGKILAVAENGGVAALWEVATRTLIKPVLAAITGGATSAVAFGPGAKVLATVSQNGVARLWDLTNFRNISVPADVGGSHNIAFSRDGRTVAAIDADLAVRVWSLSTGRLAARPIPASETGGASAVAFSPDGRILATGDLDGTVRLWDLSTGRQAAKPIPASKTAGASAVAFSPDGQILATGDDDGTVRLWNARTGQPAGALDPGGSAGVDTLAFGPGGTRLAAIYADGKLRLWDMITRQTVSPRVTVPVDGVAFSPNGYLLATADTNGTALLWNLDTGLQTGAPMIATSIDNVADAAFSPDGSLLATAGDDGDARIWDVATQHQIGPSMAGGSAASGLDAVAFTADGSALATVGADGTAALWGIEFPRDLLGAVCAIAGRSLTKQEWSTYIQTASYIKGCP